MIESYGNAEAQKVFEDGKVKKLPKALLKRAIHLLDIMDNVDSLMDLKSKGFPPDIRLHSLKGEFKGRYAIDINKIDGWRITFEFSDNKFIRVAIENYHKG
jgi:plasmid maintenance system killer protein